MAHRMDSLQHLSSIVKFALSNLQFPVKLSEDNKTRISFGHNASTILIDLEFRSTPLHNLHISEWALCNDVRIWATLGAVSKWANITGETTGNGMGNDFYMTYMDAKEGKNEYVTRFIPWFHHNEYRLPLNGLPNLKPDKRELGLGLSQDQIHFRRQMMGKLKSAFAREYPETEEDAFSQSGLMFFNNKKVISLAKEAREYDIPSPPIEDTDLYTVWEAPQKGHVYAIGADVSEGIDNDYSAFKVLCVTCRQEAMAYRGHVRLDQYYRELDSWGRKYRNALLGVERNNHGHAILLGLSEDCHYPHLFKEVRQEPIVVNLSKPRPEPKLGWGTTHETKETMLQQLKWALEGDEQEDENNFQPDLLFHDTTFLSECLTFERNQNKLSATSGKHDDTVIATAIAYQMYLKLRSRVSLEGRIGLEKAMIGGTRENKL